MMRWLRPKNKDVSESDKDLAQLPAPEDTELLRLKGLFRKAVFGTSCRTLSYTREDSEFLGKEHLHAVCMMEPDQWNIYKITENRTDVIEKQGSLNSEIYETKLLKQGLNFFEVIEALAEYEISQEDLTYTQKGADKEELGFEHYQAFARREGVVFDLEGKPHPTWKGQIVTQGKFDDNEQKALKESFETAQPPLNPAKTWDDDLITNFFGFIDSNVDWDRLVSDHKQLDTFKALHKELKALQLYLTLGIENKFNWNKADGDKLVAASGERRKVVERVKQPSHYSHYSHYDEFDDRYYDRYESDNDYAKRFFAGRSELVIDNVKNLPKKEANMTKDFLKLLSLFHVYTKAKYKVDSFREKGSAFLEQAEKAVDKASKAYEELGASADDIKQMKSSIMNAAKPEFPHQASEFIASLAQSIDNRQTIIEREWQMAQAPQSQSPQNQGPSLQA